MKAQGSMAGSVVTESPTPPAFGAALTRLRERVAAAPFASSLIVCIALALLSAAVLPTVPSYDPWSWIVWGREVFDPHLSLVIGGGSSWKPFPVIFTAIYGLFSGGPTMWVITERVGALMAFIAAYRLAAQMTARIGYARWAPLAGVIAAFSLILLQDFAYYFYRGATEPILVGCALWSVERLLAGKRWQSFMLGVALGLMRPEAWPFMIVFAAWLAWKEPTVRVRVGVLAGLAFMPFMWFAPPGITTGKWFSAATQASEYNGHLGSDPFLAVLRRGVDDQSVPVLVLALIALAITLYKERDRVVLAVGALGAAWWVVVVGETLDGYPGLERFFLPGAAIACVLAGVGVVRIGALAGELAGRLWRAGGGRAPARVAAVLAALIAVVVSYHYVDGRVTYAREQYSLTKTAVRRLNNLNAAVAAVGGHAGVFPCKSPVQSYVAINHSLQTALAFKLHSTLERVGTVMANEGLYVVGPWDSIDGGPAALNPYFNRIVFLKQVGVFKIYRVYRAGHLNRCVGI
ncbi:MAG TPA: hypothetical protein VG223_05355 [Solirubrobacteraceae bacterium]|nr:hypothetical protein [Solirubrobacteraceae bacterium]